MSSERIARLLEFLNKDPHDSFARYALALEYAAERNTFKATTLLVELVRLDSRYVPAYEQLAYLYQELDRIEDARAILRAGISVAKHERDSYACQEMQEVLETIGEQNKESDYDEEDPGIGRH
jgi:tetratricopeptide (TPR) repeat protein